MIYPGLGWSSSPPWEDRTNPHHRHHRNCECRKEGADKRSVWLFVTPWTVALQAPLSSGFFQARIVEWVAFSFSRGASQPRDQTWVSCVCCIAGRFFFFFYCKIRLLVITLYNLLPIFDVTNFRVFEIGRIRVCNWHKPQYLSSLNCFCDFFLFLPTKTCYVPSINASSKWRNKLG